MSNLGHGGANMPELYGLMLRDRETLNYRFRELSVKTSISEFVVNSKGLLDLNTVRSANETINKNEKPVPVQGDNSGKKELNQSQIKR